jgi:uncharacterized protein
MSQSAAGRTADRAARSESGGRRARRGPAGSTHREWRIDLRELARRPGTMRELDRTVPAPAGLGLPDVVAVAPGAPLRIELRLESVVEGVLVSGTASGPVSGTCSRCLEALTDQVQAEITELFAYPGTVTEASTDGDEVPRIVDDEIDLEQTVRDAVVLALPLTPLCSSDCAGLCPECGGRWADLGPEHAHETIDPRWAALRSRSTESNSS